MKKRYCLLFLALLAACAETQPAPEMAQGHLANYLEIHAGITPQSGTQPIICENSTN